MPHEAKLNPHSAYGNHYHLVWIPRVLDGPVEARLKGLLAEIAMQSGFDRLAVEVMLDHVHLFLSEPAEFSPAEIARLFTGITSRRLKKVFESLRRPYWGTNATLWAEGYPVGMAGHVRAETIQRSIGESQKEQPQVSKT